MLSLLIAAGAAACPLTEVAGAPGENHVMVHGLSPDGRTLAVGWDKGSGADTQRGAYLLDLRTGKRTELTGLDNAPSFSPDGRSLVAANYSDGPDKTEIVDIDVKTSEGRVYASSSAGEWLPTYSPDGKWILFNSTRTGHSDIYRIRRRSDALERVTKDDRYEAHASFVDGGRRIIFHRQTEGDNYDIVIRDLASGTEQLVGATAAEEAYPAMSPDGRWIAFSAVPEPGRQPNLYVMRRDGKGRVRLTEGVAKDAYATWSPDGRAIYFVRFGEGGSKILRMNMRAGHCAR
jgi:TolB protein